MSGAKRLVPTGLKSIQQAAAIFAIAALLAILVNALRPGRLPWGAEGFPSALLNPDSGVRLEIPLEEAETLFFAQAALFLDARSPELYQTGHIAAARNLPWQRFDEYFSKVMAEVPLEAPIVAYCDGESCGLSKELAMALLGHGYTNARVLVNGWTVWVGNGLPIETFTANP